MTLLELLQIIQKHLKLIIIIPIVFAIASVVFCWAVLPNTYTASVSMYVLTNSSLSADASVATLSTDLSASQMITNDVSELIQSERVLSDTATNLGMEKEELRSYSIGVTSASDTRLITIEVTGDTPSSAAAIANGLANTTNTVAQEIMDIKAVNVIDEAAIPTSPSGPNRALYVMLALFAGIILAVALVVFMDMVNTRIRKPEEIEDLLDIPVIGRIPLIK